MEGKSRLTRDIESRYFESRYFDISKFSMRYIESRYPDISKLPIRYPTLRQISPLKGTYSGLLLLTNRLETTDFPQTMGTIPPANSTTSATEVTLKSACTFPHIRLFEQHMTPSRKIFTPRENSKKNFSFLPYQRRNNKEKTCIFYHITMEALARDGLVDKLPISTAGER